MVGFPWQTNGSAVIRSSRVIPTAYGPLRITSSRLASYAVWVLIAAANRMGLSRPPLARSERAAIRARTALAEACCGLTVTNLCHGMSITAPDRQPRRPGGLPHLLNIEDVAEHLGVNVRHVRRLVAERRIPFVKWGHLLRFDPDELAAWIERGRRPAR